MSRPGDEPFEYEHKVSCVHDTPNAIKVIPVGKTISFWVPKENLHDNSEVYRKGDEGKLVVKIWFAIKERWTDGE